MVSFICSLANYSFCILEVIFTREIMVRKSHEDANCVFFPSVPILSSFTLPVSRRSKKLPPEAGIGFQHALESANTILVMLTNPIITGLCKHICQSLGCYVLVSFYCCSSFIEPGFQRVRVQGSCSLRKKIYGRVSLFVCGCNSS
ncbi:hypothetical protein L1887_21669 [Cichorium endivia]|nr:hypothetical protein L1887_21669 [Cichorium endivia]